MHAGMQGRHAVRYALRDAGRDGIKTFGGVSVGDQTEQGRLAAFWQVSWRKLPACFGEINLVGLCMQSSIYTDRNIV